MKFERNKDIKESLRIGKAGNPIRMKEIKLVSPYRGPEYLQHQYCVMGDQAKAILHGCKNVMPDLRTDFETGTYDIYIMPRDGEDRLDKDGTHVKDLAGEYIEYGDQIFPILFPIKIDMSITVTLDSDGVS